MRALAAFLSFARVSRPLVTSGAVRMAANAAPASAAPSVGTLYDMPVSNNGARARMILYYKSIGPDEVAVVSPAVVGGLRAAEYLALNPQGKMPVFVHAPTGTAIPESDTIARLLCNLFKDRGPALVPDDALQAARCDVICRHHDLYIAGIQSAMYKAAGSGGPGLFPPFGTAATRRDGITGLLRQIEILETYVDETGPYLLGATPSAADCAVFPTAVFWMHMLPKFEDGAAVAEAMGPKLTKWWTHMTQADQVGKRVFAEMIEPLKGWDDKGRFDGLLGVQRDTAPGTIFDKILSKQIPSDVVYEDDLVYAFRDISPVAPTHVLLIPKRRDGLTQLQKASAEHRHILGHMLAVGVPAIVAKEGLSAYRVVINDGADACQSVFHLHMHVIGGKQLSWPPGA